MFQLADIASLCMTDPVERKVEEVDITNWIETEFAPIMKQEDSWPFDFEWAFGESSSEALNSTTEEAREPLIPDHPDRPFPIFESGLLPEPPLGMGMEHKPSTMKNFKRVLDEDFTMSKKIKETHPDFNGEKTVPPPLIKKGEESGNLQVNQTMHEGRLKGLVKEEIHPISNFHAANELGVKKPLKLLSCTTSVAAKNLEFLSMAQLRDMARERNLKRYSKLNKSDLIKLLKGSL